MVPFKDRALFPFKGGQNREEQDTFCSDVSRHHLGTICLFSSLSLSTHSYSPPPPQTGPETTDNITSTPSFPTWLHYPMELSRLPMSSAESLGWGWVWHRRQFFLCGSRGLGEKPGSLACPILSSNPLHCLSYFCWEGSLFLGQKLRKTETLSVWFRGL